MKKIIVITLLSLCSFVYSQDKGTVVGTLTDKEMNNEALPFANVFIKGTSIGATTDFDGKYTLNVPTGSQIIVFSFVGYQTVEKQIIVKTNETLTLNQELGANEGVALDEIEIKASTSKNKASALLLDQKKATVIKESIGAEELSTKGVSDAAVAATKVAGISKQQGSNKIFVRGLGDRYNSTTLNGLPLPSNNPSYKNISLELFPTGIIQNVGVSKTFSANLTSDLAGANVDISTKEHTGKNVITIGFSSGINSQTTGGKFKKIDGANSIGYAKSTKHGVTNLNTIPFTDNFSPKNDRAAANTNLSVSGGRRFNINDESSLSMFLVGSFNNNYLTRDGISINYQRNDGSKGSSYTSAKEYRYETSKLAMGNFTYRINSNHKVTYNSVFIHSNSQNIQDYSGTKPDVADEGEIARLILQTQNQNTLFINQLLSSHKLSESIDVNSGFSFNTINNDEPNRKKNLLRRNENENVYYFASGTPRNNSRYYHNLKENDITAKLDIAKYFGGKEDNKIKLNLGYFFRNTDRLMNQYYFDYDINNQNNIADINNLSGVLNQQGLDNGIFRLKTHFGFGSDALLPMFYKGDKTTHAGYASLDYQITDKLFVNMGARFERIQMDVRWKTPQDKDVENNFISKKENYLLPTLNLKYNFTDNNIIRLAGSQTYTFPQFKEIAPFPYEGADYLEIGNPDLKPSENINIDLKWELYPSREELISATIFGKRIKNAISRVEQNAASDNNFTYQNTGDADVLGLEVEFKKNLFNLANDEDDFTKVIKLGFNASYMYTNQNLTSTSNFRPTKEEEKLEGAAPFILNTDLSYHFKKDNKQTVASLVFNYQNEKVYSVGSNLLDAIIEKALPRLDLVLKHDFSKKIGVKLSAKNLLNPSIERYRDIGNTLITKDPNDNSKTVSRPFDFVTRSFKNGVNLSLGFTYKL
ncbi:TonB-dependent receptor [Tenacibaculum haliotis]|uniref:TonB-dependent receptor n=1 Tax=Tenacibaculum haliotis TaxID=1888914 RepID=UPI0021AFE55C|nr:TonB-dependent receptor [Tenacibaculum haliotis]MCT4697734.1 TonB-dependent receptor [Tenacibaculum haliotis]